MNIVREASSGIFIKKILSNIISVLTNNKLTVSICIHVETLHRKYKPVQFCLCFYFCHKCPFETLHLYKGIYFSPCIYIIFLKVSYEEIGLRIETLILSTL